MLPAMATCAVIAIAGCSSSATSGRGEAGVKVSLVSGYEFPGGYGEALDHPGNDAIFTAVVRDLLPARQFTYTRGAAAQTYVYTPVRAQVTAVLKGGGRALQPGQLVTLRVLGGTAASTRTINEITAGPDRYEVGKSVQIFSQPPFVDPGTGAVEYVPNWSFAQSADNKTLTNLHEPGATISVDAARARAQQKADRSGWSK